MTHQLIPASRLKQIFMIAMIVWLSWTLGKELFIFFPGVLGAFMLYVLLREPYYRLTVVKGYRKWTVATLFIIGSLILILLPLYGMWYLLSPKISQLLNQSQSMTGSVKAIVGQLKAAFPSMNVEVSDKQIQKAGEKLAGSLPGFLGSAANMATNIVLAFFLLYFMLTDGRIMEREVQRFLSLKDYNIDLLWKETRTMVVSNAIGLPVLAIFQAIAAALGYLLFGIDEWILWGVVTGVFSLLPVVGTAIVWAPLVGYLYISGNAGEGTGLLLYSVLVITNVDNVLRFTLLKKLGDVHPIITVVGLIAGVPLFGFMGLVFGPLLLSYLLLLIKVYRIEFSKRPSQELLPQTDIT
jgi:predicted PurR-regulated permease PerM